ncbi:related to benzoate 4-monooxygenase cytochrome P450 [Cephalotrichum gorgonifer]|uniref:Related to benzoate 4-monooxygenase cytochrome P450 n=1 Tax=Cephalotrichum gorgonifer TaxID=2041049 RepID=A0AAE8SVS8_9PEZI|nr:related to benzoate 4-monooxygenase cytochrome P450 [Cephalotrichum gorgonifer]
MTSSPFLTRVHYYNSPTRHSCAYESGTFDSPNVIVAIGGLGDGPHTVPYFRDLAVRLDSANGGPGYSVFEFRLKSSFIGFGTSSLAEDVRHISDLVKYLRGIGKERIVLLGHSTGCQDIMAYVNDANYTKHGIEPVEGFILQGPVSDREAIEAERKDGFDQVVADARVMVADGRGGDCLPQRTLPDMLAGTPVSAYRFLALATKGGDDDYFSSDLETSVVSKIWSSFDRPFLVLHSAEDEFVPSTIDKKGLIEGWRKENTLMSPLSGLIPGANHTVDSEEARTRTYSRRATVPPIMLLFSPLFLLAAATLILAAGLIRCLTSPLAKIPGPRVSLFTSLVLKWNELRANRRGYIHALHVRYGPVVRVSPHEVSFTSALAVKEIYCSGGSGYDKTEFYDLFRVYGRRTMFTTLNKSDHSKRRRIIADRYANSNIMRPVSMTGIQERASKFITKCNESVGQSLDIFLCTQNKDHEEMMHQVASDDSLQNRLIEFYSPTLHQVTAKLLYSLAKPRETPMADEFVLKASGQSDPADFTLLKRMLEKSELDPIDYAAECLDHMAAGIDTTGDALCFLMWELSRPGSFHFQEKLRAELRDRAGKPLDQLPFLEAVVSEGLRYFPAIPMSLPRYVPHGGKVIDGYVVPGGTVVSCQAYSVHRLNEDVFPDAERFDPERWLEPEGDAERRRLQFAFASGGRGCVGKHLALAEMKTLLAEVYSRFSTTVDSGTTVADMDMSDQLISSRPAGQRCLLRFEPIEGQ